MQTLFDIETIVNNLEQHPNSVRLKKLIFYSCTKRWENDSTILNQYPLKNLIQALIESHSSIEDLKTDLDTLVKTLNHQTEYSLIASVISNELEKLYRETEPLTQVIVNRNQSQSNSENVPSIFDEIAQELEADQNYSRIKKLVFYVCHDRWENNPNHLATINLAQLIETLAQSNPTLDQLTLAITRQVQTLNRQAEYSTIAHTIISKLEILYEDSSDPTLIKASQTSQVPSAPELIDQPVQPNPSLVQGSQKNTTYDPFNLRLELMNYTNPLRAKLLLFSVLYHPFQATRQDWYLIRAKTLDELLWELFKSAETLEELKGKLYSTALNLDAKDENNQAASAIVQCLSRFYDQSK